MASRSDVPLLFPRWGRELDFTGELLYVGNVRSFGPNRPAVQCTLLLVQPHKWGISPLSWREWLSTREGSRAAGLLMAAGPRAGQRVLVAAPCSPEPLRTLSRSQSLTRDGCLHVCSYLLVARVSSGSREALMAEQAISVLLTALPSAPEWQVSNTCLARIETDFK